MLVAAVPVVVAAASVAAFRLRRAGFVVWGPVPFLASMLVIAGLGVFLGRAAARPSGGEGRPPEDDGV